MATLQSFAVSPVVVSTDLGTGIISITGGVLNINGALDALDDRIHTIECSSSGGIRSSAGASGTLRATGGRTLNIIERANAHRYGGDNGKQSNSNGSGSRFAGDATNTLVYEAINWTIEAGGRTDFDFGAGTNANGSLGTGVTMRGVYVNIEADSGNPNFPHLWSSNAKLEIHPDLGYGLRVANYTQSHGLLIEVQPNAQFAGLSIDNISSVASGGGRVVCNPPANTTFTLFNLNTPDITEADTTVSTSKTLLVDPVGVPTRSNNWGGYNSIMEIQRTVRFQFNGADNATGTIKALHQNSNAEAADADGVINSSGAGSVRVKTNYSAYQAANGAWASLDGFQFYATSLGFRKYYSGSTSINVGNAPTTREVSVTKDELPDGTAITDYTSTDGAATASEIYRIIKKHELANPTHRTLGSSLATIDADGNIDIDSTVALNASTSQSAVSVWTAATSTLTVKVQLGITADKGINSLNFGNRSIPALQIAYFSMPTTTSAGTSSQLTVSAHANEVAAVFKSDTNSTKLGNNSFTSDGEWTLLISAADSTATTRIGVQRAGYTGQGRTVDLSAGGVHSVSFPALTQELDAFQSPLYKTDANAGSLVEGQVQSATSSPFEPGDVVLRVAQGRSRARDVYKAYHDALAATNGDGCRSAAFGRAQISYAEDVVRGDALYLGPDAILQRAAPAADNTEAEVQAQVFGGVGGNLVHDTANPLIVTPGVTDASLRNAVWNALTSSFTNVNTMGNKLAALTSAVFGGGVRRWTFNAPFTPSTAVTAVEGVTTPRDVSGSEWPVAEYADSNEDATDPVFNRIGTGELIAGELGLPFTRPDISATGSALREVNWVWTGKASMEIRDASSVRLSVDVSEVDLGGGNSGATLQVISYDDTNARNVNTHFQTQAEGVTGSHTFACSLYDDGSSRAVFRLQIDGGTARQWSLGSGSSNPTMPGDQGAWTIENMRLLVWSGGSKLMMCPRTTLSSATGWTPPAGLAWSASDESYKATDGSLLSGFMTLNGLTSGDVANAVWNASTDNHTTDNSFGKKVDGIVLSSPTAAAIADAVWDEAVADHNTSGTTGAKQNLLGTGGSTLTASVIADAVWDEAASGHTTSGSFGAVAAAANTTTPPTTAAIADAVWDEPTSGHATDGTFGEHVADLSSGGGGGSGPTAAAIADAVWDEAASGHATAGTFGALAAAANTTTPPTASSIADAVWDEALSGHSTSGSAGKALADGGQTAASIAAAVWDASLGSHTDTGSAGLKLSDANTTTPPTPGAVADAVWDEALSDHTDSGSAGDTLADAYSGTPPTPPTAASIADAVWDEAASGHTASGSFGSRLSTAGSYTIPSASTIADAVWDEAASGHTTTGSFGEQLGDLTIPPSVSAIADAVWDEALSSHDSTGTAGERLGDLATPPTATAIADTVWREDISDISGSNSAAQAVKNAGTSASSIADAVWNEALSGHTTAGSAGKALSDNPTAANIADSVWDEQTSGHTVVGSAGATLRNTFTGSVPSASSIADAVWDEALSGHATTGTTGKKLADLTNTGGGGGGGASAADIWNALMSNHTTAGSFGAKLGGLSSAVAGNTQALRSFNTPFTSNTAVSATLGTTHPVDTGGHGWPVSPGQGLLTFNDTGTGVLEDGSLLFGVIRTDLDGSDLVEFNLVFQHKPTSSNSGASSVSVLDFVDSSSNLSAFNIKCDQSDSTPSYFVENGNNDISLANNVTLNSWHTIAVSCVDDGTTHPPVRVQVNGGTPVAINIGSDQLAFAIENFARAVFTATSRSEVRNIFFCPRADKSNSNSGWTPGAGLTWNTVQRTYVDTAGNALSTFLTTGDSADQHTLDQIATAVRDKSLTGAATGGVGAVLASTKQDTDTARRQLRQVIQSLPLTPFAPFSPDLAVTGTPGMDHIRDVESRNWPIVGQNVGMADGSSGYINFPEAGNGLIQFSVFRRNGNTLESFTDESVLVFGLRPTAFHATNRQNLITSGGMRIEIEPSTGSTAQLRVGSVINQPQATTTRTVTLNQWNTIALTIAKKRPTNDAYPYVHISINGAATESFNVSSNEAYGNIGNFVTHFNMGNSSQSFVGQVREIYFHPNLSRHIAQLPSNDPAYPLAAADIRPQGWVPPTGIRYDEDDVKYTVPGNQAFADRAEGVATDVLEEDVEALDEKTLTAESVGPAVWSITRPGITASNANDAGMDAQLKYAAQNSPTASSIADAVWDEAASGHTTAGSMGVLLNNANSTTPPTAASIADAVWGEALSTYTTAGTAGKQLADAYTGTPPTPPTASSIADAVWDEALSGHTTAGTAGLELASVYSDTPPSAASIADAVWDEATSGHTSSGSTGARLLATNTTTPTAAPTAASIADAVWDEALNTHTSAGSAGAQLGSSFTGTVPSAASIADAVWDEATSGHATDGTFGEHVAGLSGGGSTLTAAGIADAVWDEALSGHTTAGSAAAQLSDAYTGTPPTPPSAASIADAVWDETAADHVGSGSTGAQLAATNTTTPPTPPSTADIADAVWDEALSGHTNAGTAGAQLSDTYTDTPPTPPTASSIADAVWDEALSGHSTSGTAGAQLGDAYTGTPPTPPSASSIADAVWDELTSAHSVTGSFGAKLAGLTSGGGSSVSAADIADAVWDEALSGHTTAGSAAAQLSDAYTGTPPTASAIATAVAAPSASDIATAVDGQLTIPSASDIATAVDAPTASEIATAVDGQLTIPSASDIATAVDAPSASDIATAVSNELTIPTTAQIAQAVRDQGLSGATAGSIGAKLSSLVNGPDAAAIATAVWGAAIEAGIDARAALRLLLALNGGEVDIVGTRWTFKRLDAARTTALSGTATEAGERSNITVADDV